MHAVEYQTLKDLDRLALSLMTVCNQSLIICERILGPRHTVSRIVDRGYAYWRERRFQCCLDLWNYGLELTMSDLDQVHSLYKRAAKELMHLYPQGNELRLADVVRTTELLAARLYEAAELPAAQSVFNTPMNILDFSVLGQLFFVLHRLPKSVEEDVAVQQLVARALSRDPRISTRDTLLHLVVSN